jgi:outer membrane protein OmpA-like peptidoglycan-associated protein
MKIIQPATILVLLGLLGTPLPAQTKQLDDKDLAAIDSKPKVSKPRFIPKSSSKGPVVEKGRQYIFTAKGAQSKAARVISMSDGSKVTTPLVNVPLLFKRNQAVLADSQSQANLKVLATKLTSLPTAKFCIEGHASAEGEKSHNQKLSEARARTIRQALELLGVPASSFTTTTGLGSNHAQHPAHSSESSLAQDRRVLLIREH